MGKNFNDFDFGGLRLEDENIETRKAKEIEEQLSIPITLEELNAINMLNVEQKSAYEIIYNRVMERRPGAFFVDSPAGTGKTFLYSALLAQLRKKGFIVLAVASSGIAPSNISGGRTSNSLFKIPLDLEENQGSKISKQSSLAELIRVCKLIIWDEAPMAKRQSIEHFERTLRDICSKNIPFGGKVVVFGGDFRQVLPVIPKSTLREAINASLVMSPLWPTLEKIRLTINMRAINDPCFSDFVLRVGEGSSPYENGKDITLPRAIVIRCNQHLSLLESLIEAIYPNVDDINLNSFLTTKKAILTPKNEDTEAINSILVSRQRGEAFEYKSFDEAIDITTEQYPIEFLNTLNPGGLPPHHLVLKKTVR
ncbi:ATP-dependent DNA helicase PIF1-like [Silene latifolia]|uniref:ATP-dependent DNA helicase PIF1-like n=1 Tax=Silene latifolia TaxID=37657 RepID=UPI003D77ACA0